METTKKVEKSDRVKKEEKRQKRADDIVSVIQAILFLSAVTLCFYNLGLAIILIIWLLENNHIYEKACDWMCIDEIDIPDSVLGLKTMLKGQIALIPLLAVAAILVLTNYPIAALIYGFFAFIIFCFYEECKLFNF